MEWRYSDGGRKEAGYEGEVSDCVVRSIAIATKRPYDQVYDDLTGVIIRQAVMRKPPGKGRFSRPRGSPEEYGVPKEVFFPYLRSLGWRWTSRRKERTRLFELPPGRLIVELDTWHLTCVIDGMIHDIFDASEGGTRIVRGYYSNIPHCDIP